MNNESFLETVRHQYAEEIQEAYLECEHEDGRQIDLAKLNHHLAKLMKNAKVDGLSNRDFLDLVKSTLPEVAHKLDFGSAVGKAAA